MTKHKSYAKSPLGIMLVELLEKIALIKRQYPESAQAPDFVERKHAHKLINALEIILKKLNKEVFPEFDNYKTPGLMSMLSIFKDLHNLRKLKPEFNTLNYTVFEAVIAALPDALKKAQRQSKDATEIAKAISTELEKQKNDFLKNAAHIPGDPDYFFTDMIKKITHINTFYSNIDLNSSDCLPKLERALKLLLIPDPTFEVNFTIAHPMTFEFAELLIKLLDNAPSELEQLTPFLNPKAFEADFHSGLTGSAVKAILGVTVESKLDTKKQTDTSRYHYTITTHEEDQKSEELINGSQYYKNFTEEFRPYFLSPILDYFIKAENTPYVRDHLAKAAVLKRFTELELEAIDKPIALHREACLNAPDLAESEPLDAINTLTEAIKNNESLLKQNHQLVNSLKKENKAYTTEQAGNFLGKHAELSGQLNTHTQEGISTRYCLSPLPDLLIGYTNARSQQVGLIPVQKKLTQHIEERIQELQKIEIDLQDKLNSQRTLRQKNIISWQQQAIAAHLSETKKQMTVFERFEQELGQISKVSSTQDNEASLTEAVMKNQKVYSQLAQLHEEASDQLEAIKKAADLPEHLQALDINQVLQTAQKTASQSVIEHAQNVLNQIHQAQLEQHDEVHILEARLEKAKSEAKFARSMQSANPEELNRFLTEVNQKIEQLQMQQQQLNDDLAALNQKRAAQKEQLVTIEEQVRHTTNQFVAYDMSYQALIQKLYSDIQTHAPLRLSPEIDELIAHYDGLMKFVAEAGSSLNVTLQHKQDTASFLSEVNTLIDKGREKAIIPFKKIKGLSIPATIKQQTKLKGFEFLLAITGLQSVIDWKDYRHRQDDLFKTKPDQNEYNHAVGLLRDKILEVNTQTSSTEHIIQINNELPKIQSQLASYQQERIKWSSALTKANKELETNRSLSTELQQKESETKNHLLQVVAQEAQLQISHDFLERIIKVIARIKTQQQHIQAFEENNDLTLGNEHLYTQIADLQKAHQELLMATQDAESIVAQSENATVYEANIQTLYKLLESAQQRLATAIKSKVDMDPLHVQLTELSSELEAISKHPAEESIDQLIERFNTCISSINENNGLMDQLGKNIQVLKDQQTNQRFDALFNSLYELRQKQNATARVLSDDLTRIFTQVKTEAQVFRVRGLQEQRTLYEEHAAQLNTAREKLNAFPNEEQMNFFTDQQRTNIQSLKSAITEQIAQSETANQALNARILERAVLVEQVIIPGLTSYWDARKLLYPIKDSIIPQDKNKRQHFIETLQDKLNEYTVSGDSHDVLNFIELKMPHFRGIKLHVLLNKITTEILDLDHKIPKNYHLEIPEDELFNEKHERAITLLRNHEQTHPEYCAAINKLYALIQNMHDSWPDKAELTEKLRHDVDRLVLAHPESVPDKTQYNRFKKHFTARLHSEEIERPQRAAWKLNLANIAVGVLTLGIALGIKLIHSKVVEGRYKLFFEKTNEEKERLAQAVQINIATPGT